jgi:hypothetical protein
MIIIKLTGGLGNQLFQYAIGRAISIQSQDKLYFDISSYSWDKLRAYALTPFSISAEIASKSDIEILKGLKPSFNDRILYKLKGQKIPYYKLPFIKEQSFIYDVNFKFFRKKNIYLEGYWQSEYYFKTIRSFLITELSVGSKNFSQQGQRFRTQIESDPNSVSIHVRRGDYVSNSETTDFHGLCDIQYYKRAIQKIILEIPNPTFYIFSDDKDYVKEIFQEKKNVVFIEHIPVDYEELLLMSYCKHNIIANSSFSWWGAWLNSNIHKIVIAPIRWFANTDMQQKVSDLLPIDWRKI